MANIKKGDLVQVITGATQARGGSRGKQGRVLEVFAEKNRVIVEGVNFVTKHVQSMGSVVSAVWLPKVVCGVCCVCQSCQILDNRASKHVLANLPKACTIAAQQTPHTLRAAQAREQI